MASMGTGYSPPRRPSDAFATCVSDCGTRMLSAFVATNATPRNTHIEPSVMMNGCTLSPTTSAPLITPHTRPMPAQMRSATQAVAPSPIGPMARNAMAIVTPASA